MKRKEPCPQCGKLSINTDDPVGVPTKLKCVCGHVWFEPRGLPSKPKPRKT